MITRLSLVEKDSPILRSKTELVPEDRMVDAVALGLLMIPYMRYWGGIGLAAPQVGHNVRMFVMVCNDKENEICINPRVLESHTPLMNHEGCLTFPGKLIKIKRPNFLIVSYVNKELKLVTKYLSELDAVCFQHELDHLDGILFMDKVDVKG